MKEEHQEIKLFLSFSRKHMVVVSWCFKLSVSQYFGMKDTRQNPKSPFHSRCPPIRPEIHMLIKLSRLGFAHSPDISFTLTRQSLLTWSYQLFRKCGTVGTNAMNSFVFVLLELISVTRSENEEDAALWPHQNIGCRKPCMHSFKHFK